MNWLRPIISALLIAIVAVIPMTLLTPDSAHSQTQPAFDHFTTGFRLEGMHRFADCEACHNNGVFTGTPATCYGCHSQAGQIQATRQPPRHITTTERCDACHRPIAWSPVARVDHLEVQGTCSSCHDNFRARGQHPQHIPTTSDCEACHNTRFWRL